MLFVSVDVLWMICYYVQGFSICYYVQGFILLCCCIVMPAWTVLLFYPNHSYWCVFSYVYYYWCNSRAQVAGHGNSSKNSVPARLLRHQSSLDCRVGHSRRLAVVGPVSWWWIISTLFATLCCITYTLSTKQSLGQDIPASSGESSGSSGA